MDYVRAFLGRPLSESPGQYAGSVHFPGEGWKNATIRFKAGCVDVDVSKLPAIIDVSATDCYLAFEKGGRMRCFDIIGNWTYEEVNVKLHYQEKEGGNQK